MVPFSQVRCYKRSAKEMRTAMYPGTQSLHEDNVRESLLQHYSLNYASKGRPEVYFYVTIQAAINPSPPCFLCPSDQHLCIIHRLVLLQMSERSRFHRKANWPFAKAKFLSHHQPQAAPTVFQHVEASGVCLFVSADIQPDISTDTRVLFRTSCASAHGPFR